jgi:hypothetical protein
VRILHATEQIDRNGMAHVWAPYVLYRDGQWWKVGSFADSDNALNGKPIRTVCPD